MMIDKHFQERSAEPQISRFARDDKKERFAVWKGRLLKERTVPNGQGGC
jgi:hypothetical protein